MGGKNGFFSYMESNGVGFVRLLLYAASVLLAQLCGNQVPVVLVDGTALLVLAVVGDWWACYLAVTRGLTDYVCSRFRARLEDRLRSLHTIFPDADIIVVMDGDERPPEKQEEVQRRAEERRKYFTTGYHDSQMRSARATPSIHRKALKGMGRALKIDSTNGCGIMRQAVDAVFEPQGRAHVVQCEGEGDTMISMLIRDASEDGRKVVVVGTDVDLYMPNLNLCAAFVRNVPPASKSRRKIQVLDPSRVLAHVEGDLVTASELPLSTRIPPAVVALLIEAESTCSHSDWIDVRGSSFVSWLAFVAERLPSLMGCRITDATLVTLAVDHARDLGTHLEPALVLRHLRYYRGYDGLRWREVAADAAPHVVADNESVATQAVGFMLMTLRDIRKWDRALADVHTATVARKMAKLATRSSWNDYVAARDSRDVTRADSLYDEYEGRRLQFQCADADVDNAVLRAVSADAAGRFNPARKFAFEPRTLEKPLGLARFLNEHRVDANAAELVALAEQVGHLRHIGHVHLPTEASTKRGTTQTRATIAQNHTVNARRDYLAAPLFNRTPFDGILPGAGDLIEEQLVVHGVDAGIHVADTAGCACLVTGLQDVVDQADRIPAADRSRAIIIVLQCKKDVGPVAEALGDAGVDFPLIVINGLPTHELCPRTGPCIAITPGHPLFGAATQHLRLCIVAAHQVLGDHVPVVTLGRVARHLCEAASVSVCATDQHPAAPAHRGQHDWCRASMVELIKSVIARGRRMRAGAGHDDVRVQPESSTRSRPVTPPSTPPAPPTTLPSDTASPSTARATPTRATGSEPSPPRKKQRTGTDESEVEEDVPAPDDDSVDAPAHNCEDRDLLRLLLHTPMSPTTEAVVHEIVAHAFGAAVASAVSHGVSIEHLQAAAMTTVEDLVGSDVTDIICSMPTYPLVLLPRLRGIETRVAYELHCADRLLVEAHHVNAVRAFVDMLRTIAYQTGWLYDDDDPYDGNAPVSEVKLGHDVTQAATLRQVLRHTLAMWDSQEVKQCHKTQAERKCLRMASRYARTASRQVSWDFLLDVDKENPAPPPPQYLNLLHRLPILEEAVQIFRCVAEAKFAANPRWMYPKPGLVGTTWVSRASKVSKAARLAVDNAIEYHIQHCTTCDEAQLKQLGANNVGTNMAVKFLGNIKATLQTRWAGLAVHLVRMVATMPPSGDPATGVPHAGDALDVFEAQSEGVEHVLYLIAHGLCIPISKRGEQVQQRAAAQERTGSAEMESVLESEMSDTHDDPDWVPFDESVPDIDVAVPVVHTVDWQHRARAALNAVSDTNIRAKLAVVVEDTKLWADALAFFGTSPQGWHAELEAEPWRYAAIVQQLNVASESEGRGYVQIVSPQPNTKGLWTSFTGLDFAFLTLPLDYGIPTPLPSTLKLWDWAPGYRKFLRQNNVFHLGSGATDGEGVSLYVACMRKPMAWCSPTGQPPGSPRDTAFRAAGWLPVDDNKHPRPVSAAEAKFKLCHALTCDGERTRGLILERALLNGNVTCSKDELDSILEASAIVCVDLGRKSLAAVTIVSVERDDVDGGYRLRFVYFLWRARAFYDAYDNEQREEWFDQLHPELDNDVADEVRAAAEGRAQQIQQVIEELGKTTCRTCDPEQVLSHCVAVLDGNQGGVLRELAHHPDQRRRRFRAKSNKRRLYDEFVQNIEQHCRALGKLGKPLVLVGKPTFSPTAQGWRPAPTKAIVSKLSSTFATVLLDEYNSSQRCPRCHRRARVVDQEEQMYECTGSCVHYNTDVRFTYNKDISAGINFLFVFLYIVQWRERPPAFRPPPSDVQRGAPIHGADQISGLPSTCLTTPDTGTRPHATTTTCGNESNDQSRV